MTQQSSETIIDRTVIKDEPFEDIRRRYYREWLVVEVTENNEFTEPTRGMLIAHVKDMKTAYEIEKRHKGKLTATFYNLPPEEYNRLTVL